MPAGDAAGVRWVNPRRAAGRFEGEFGAQPDCHYGVQASSNLVQWQPLAALLATNGTVGFADTNAAGSPRFYRAVTLP